MGCPHKFSLCCCYWKLLAVSNSLRPHGLLHSRFLCPSLFTRIFSESCPLSLSNHLTISSSVSTLSFCPQSFPASGSFPMSQFFASGGQRCFSISPSNGYLVLISFRIDWFDPWSPRNSQESSPAPQFKSINSSSLSPLYGPTFTSIRDYWKKHSFESRPLLAKWCICFIHCLAPSKEEASFNFMAAVTVCSDFGDQENNICHCFYFFPFYSLFTMPFWSLFSLYRWV